MDKKDLKKAKDDFALHVALIMRGGASKPVAMATAYAQGPDGLAKMLGEQLALPLTADVSKGPGLSIKAV